jgi:tetratricopeptide (TPR) repeat protein
MTDYEQIESYLQGRLTGDELRQFEHRLQTDSQFAETVQLYRNIHAEIWPDDDELLLKQHLRELDKKHFMRGSEPPVVPMRKWYRLAAAAAIVAAVIVTITLLTGSQKSADLLFAELTVRDSLRAVVRGDKDSLKPIIAQAYNSRQYATALPLLEQYAEDNPADAAYNFARGVCYAETGDISAAVKCFDTVISGSSIYKYKAVAAKAQILFTQQRTGEAAELLKTIPPDATDYKKAQQLIKKLQ